MFRTALADERRLFGDKACEQLVRELSVATGTDAMIALLDVAGADREIARATIAHMVDALVSGSLGKTKSVDR